MDLETEIYGGTQESESAYGCDEETEIQLVVQPKPRPHTVLGAYGTGEPLQQGRRRKANGFFTPKNAVADPPKPKRACFGGSSPQPVFLLA